MRQLARDAVRGALTALARLALVLHAPNIVAITGSVGKTTTKDMVTAILRQAGLSVRGSAKSYNGDFGVPLSILGLSSGVRNPFLWMYTLVAGVYASVCNIPNYIVLEVGLEMPGDIYGIVKWLHPTVSVVTKLPEHPVHLENFPDKRALYDEKMSLLLSTKKNGAAVYSGEDAVQTSYIQSLPETVRTYVFNGETVSVVSSDIHYDEQRTPIGTDVVLAIQGKEEPMYIPDVLGDGAVQSLAAAVAAVIALAEDIPVQTIRMAVASREPTPGRMRILRGVNGSTIIDDSYNASPVALRAALRTLDALEGKKKVAVLGAMAQLGEQSSDLHRSLGKRAAEAADIVVVVGGADYGTGDNIHYAGNTDEAVRTCRALADAGVLFLCKGSQIARIEKVVRQILDPSVDPGRALIRQEAYWE